MLQYYKKQFNNKKESPKQTIVNNYLKEIGKNAKIGDFKTIVLPKKVKNYPNIRLTQRDSGKLIIINNKKDALEAEKNFFLKKTSYYSLHSAGRNRANNSVE